MAVLLILCHTRRRLAAIIQVILLIAATRLGAVELRLDPDSVQADRGQTVWLSGNIGPSESMRAFTVYLDYDTTALMLGGAPVPGALIAQRNGLDFRYLDHVASEPEWLEIGGTVFSDDFWSGPGELFRIPLVLRECGDLVITAPFGIALRNVNDLFQTGTFRNGTILSCRRIPQAAREFTIVYAGNDSVLLRWRSVAFDTLSRPLLSPPSYSIFRQPGVPGSSMAESLATIPDTAYTTSLGTAVMYRYWIKVSANP
jgi:hypothetical protein